MEKDPMVETGLVTLSLDYCFASSSEDEGKSAGERPVLVLVHNKTEGMHAAVSNVCCMFNGIAIAADSIIANGLNSKPRCSFSFPQGGGF